MKRLLHYLFIFSFSLATLSVSAANSTDSVRLKIPVNKSFTSVLKNKKFKPSFYSGINNPYFIPLNQFPQLGVSTSILAQTNEKTTENTIKKAIANPSSVTDQDKKLVDNVEIYPNPVSDQLNINFTLKKESFITAKILDILGNEVITLYAQKVAAGDQSISFSISSSSKLSSGFYFVRVSSASDSVIKRIYYKPN